MLFFLFLEETSELDSELESLDSDPESDSEPELLASDL